MRYPGMNLHFGANVGTTPGARAMISGGSTQNLSTAGIDQTVLMPPWSLELIQLFLYQEPGTGASSLFFRLYANNVVIGQFLRNNTSSSTTFIPPPGQIITEPGALIRATCELVSAVTAGAGAQMQLHFARPRMRIQRVVP